jgi:hypothetical protein
MSVALLLGSWEMLGCGFPHEAMVNQFFLYPVPPGVPIAPAPTLIILLYYWHLWQHRTGAVFQGRRPHLPLVSKNYQDGTCYGEHCFLWNPNTRQGNGFVDSLFAMTESCGSFLPLCQLYEKIQVEGFLPPL